MDHKAGMEYLKTLQGDHETPQPEWLEVRPIGDALKTLFLDPEREARLQKEQEVLEDRSRQQNAWRLWQDADVPERHSDVSKVFSGDRWLSTFAMLEKRLGDNGFIVGLIGPRGTGKTQLAVQLIRAACRNQHSARYVKAQSLFRLIRATYRDDAKETEDAVVKQFVAYNLLVIDEAHDRGHSDFENRTLTHILDMRYDRVCDTILISNETVEAFSAAVGPSIISRLNETGEIIECDWSSYR